MSKRNLFQFLFFSIIAALMFFPAGASSITDGCKELPQSEVQEIVEQCAMHVTDREPRKTNFDCFAVREDQYYAIGYDAGFQRNYDEIAVFDASGRFLYTIIFDDNGSFSLMWEGDTLLVHFTRGGLILALNRDGICTAAYDSDDDYEIGNRFYKYSNMFSRNKGKTNEVNGYDYVVSKSKIERTDPSGKTVTLYRASLFPKWAVLIVVLGSFLLLIWIVLKTNQASFQKE